MPEGDTVWLAAQRLDGCLAGEELLRADLRVPALATVDLRGRSVRSVRAYGKHLLFHLDDDVALHTHFRMDGSWHLYRHGRRWKGGPAWQVRAVLETRDWQAVGYRLPLVEILDSRGQEALLGRLGPDILDDGVDIVEIVTRLRGQPDRAIGDALLDQATVAGFGLIYVSETLFLRGVSPHASIRDIEDLEALVQTGRALMGANRDRGAQASTGDLRQQHYVYGRGGRPCLRCGTRINYGRQRSGRYERDAFWCPHCQAPGEAKRRE
jgi:endonuclease VIII